MLTKILNHASSPSTKEDDFEQVYEGFTFEAEFGDENLVELCQNGSEKILTRENPINHNFRNMR